MARFHPLKIRDVRPETKECNSYAFEIPDDLREHFRYLPGQHLTLQARIDGELFRRNYSLCSCPSEGEWRIAIKRIPGGRFSNWANDNLRVGDVIEVMPPIGNFVVRTDPALARHHLAFVAGSGITPVMSILKAVLKEEPQSLFTLFYVNRSTDTIIFREELEALKNRYLQRFSLHHILTREHPGSDLLHGRPDAAKVRALARTLFTPDDVDEFYLCGPGEMIEEVRSTLMDLGVATGRIHFERFTSPEQDQHTGGRSWQPPTDGDVHAHITITLDGKTFSFDQPTSGRPILDAALAAGADLPFACKGGVCCTCKARIISGKAAMEVNWGLEEEEVQKGYILTCQAHPLTSELVLTFDE